MAYPQTPPPPYNEITGLYVQTDKHANVTLAAYNGNARPGQLVVDTSNYALYIGNANGNLNIVSGGSGGSPGGANTQLQFNDAGSFGGSANLTFDKTTNTVSVGNVLQTVDLTVTGNVRSNLLPNANVTYNLGSSTQRWKDIWLANSTIYIGNASISDGANGISFGNSNLVVGGITNGNSNVTLTSNSKSWTFDSAGNLTVPSGGAINGDGNNPGPTLSGFGLITTANANVGQTLNVTGNVNVGNLNVAANAYMPNIGQFTTGTSPVLLWDDGGNGTVGYDSTIYYDHTNETLNIGNLGISDTPAATGVAISTVGDTGAGTLFFNMNGNNVISFTDDRRVKWALLTAANIPNAAVGSIIYNNDTGNAANGFYLCADGTVSASWDKIMAAKGGVVTLPSTTTAPTAVAGGIYYNSTDKKFYMCANTSLGWQSVNLT